MAWIIESNRARSSHLSRGVLLAVLLVLLAIGHIPRVAASAPIDGTCEWTVTMLTNIGAQVRWCYIDHVVEYQVEYRSQGTSEWRAVTSKRNWLLVAKLEGGVAYEFRLSARGDGDPYLTTWGTRTEIKRVVYPHRLRLEKIAALAFVVDEPKSVTLPSANGGTPPLTYRLTPSLPEWMSFDDETRVLSGVSTDLAAPTVYRYKVTDQTGSNVWHEFTIEVRPPDLGGWYDANGDRVIDRSEVVEAIADYYDYAISRDSVVEVINLYLRATPTP